jgi:hypothetical protein
MLQNLRWQTQDTDSADTAWRWISLSWLAAIIGGVYGPSITTR